MRMGDQIRADIPSKYPNGEAFMCGGCTWQYGKRHRGNCALSKEHRHEKSGGRLQIEQRDERQCKPTPIGGAAPNSWIVDGFR